MVKTYFYQSIDSVLVQSPCICEVEEVADI